MKISTAIIMFLALLYLGGCAPQVLPDKSTIQGSYSLADIKTFSSELNCENPKVAKLTPEFTQDYCQLLAANIRVALRRNNRNLKYDAVNPELVVQTTLEEINGGNTTSLFWFGFGVDSSTSTVLVTVVKNCEIIAEKRITKTTTLPILETNAFADEDAILQDAALLANKIGQFINDPVKFEKDSKTSWGPLLDFGN